MNEGYPGWGGMAANPGTIGVVEGVKESAEKVFFS